MPQEDACFIKSIPEQINFFQIKKKLKKNLSSSQESKEKIFFSLKPECFVRKEEKKKIIFKMHFKR